MYERGNRVVTYPTKLNSSGMRACWLLLLLLLLPARGAAPLARGTSAAAANHPRAAVGCCISVQFFRSGPLGRCTFALVGVPYQSGWDRNETQHSGREVSSVPVLRLEAQLGAGPRLMHLCDDVQSVTPASFFSTSGRPARVLQHLFGLNVNKERAAVCRGPRGGSHGCAPLCCCLIKTFFSGLAPSREGILQSNVRLFPLNVRKSGFENL